MFLDAKPKRRILGIGLALVLAGCTADGASEAPPPGSPSDPAPPSIPEVDVQSRSPSLKRKDGEQLTLDLALALELDRDEVCRELGRYDCARDAHRIVLGGVEPYQLRIDRPLPAVGVSAPLAVERVALSACSARARADFAPGATPVVFGPLVEGRTGGRGEVVDALYERLLGRAPDSEERTMLSEWTEPGLTDAHFATLACFVVATTLEQLFY